MAVLGERERQEELKAAGRFEFTCADEDLSDADCLAILTEEVGEVAREVLSRVGLVHDGDQSPEKLRAELAQVAAVCVAWMEAL